MENGDDNGASLLVAVIGSAAAGCACALIIRILSRAWKSAPRISTSAVENESRINGKAKQQQKKQRISPPPASRPPPPPPPAQSIPDREIVKKPLLPQTKPKPTPRHHLELNVLKGHVDAITGIAFSSNGRGLASACADRVVRIFKLDDPCSKNQHVLKLNVPVGTVPTGVAFGPGASQIVVTTQEINGAGLLMFGASEGKAAALAREQGKLPPPEIKWSKSQIHDKKSVLNCVGARCEYGSGDGSSVLVATCSEGTDIKLWLAANGNCVATIDTNQLQNTMVAISPDGRFLAAAAFTADVKVWEIVYGKDGQVREVAKVMLLKGHKSAVTWTCFTWDSQRVITASKDCTLRIWNINVRYQMDEDPKCIKLFSIAPSVSGAPCIYDKIGVSPDNKVLAATQGTTLLWLNTENGEVLDVAANAHDGEITCLAWAPQPLTTDSQGKVLVLVTASVDRKLKLWSAPSCSKILTL